MYHQPQSQRSPRDGSGRRQDPDRAEVPYPADVVVAPPDCPPPVLRWADTLRLPVVSSEWAIASVITYSRQSYQGRPEFRHTWRAADDA